MVTQQQKVAIVTLLVISKGSLKHKLPLSQLAVSLGCFCPPWLPVTLNPLTTELHFLEVLFRLVTPFSTCISTSAVS